MCDEEEGAEEEVSDSGAQDSTGVSMSGEIETAEQLQEAFLAGWRAKQKTTSLRTRRGFVPPRTRSAGPASSGQESSARSAPISSSRKPVPDSRK